MSKIFNLDTRIFHLIPYAGISTLFFILFLSATGCSGIGEPCIENEDCKVGLKCNYISTPAKCSMPDVVGVLCNYHTRCPDGLICNPGYKYCRTPSNLGEKCELYSGLGCSKNFYCKDGTCVPRSGEGEKCVHDISCKEGLHCNLGYKPAICRLKNNEGEVCEGDYDCIEGLKCNYKTNPPVCMGGNVGIPCITSIEPSINGGIVGRETSNCEKLGLTCNNAFVPPICPSVDTQKRPVVDT